MIGVFILMFLILLPLIPAYFLFKVIPSTADIEGPWQGIKVKLTGAFGGYILLLLILCHYHNLWSPYQVWELRGWVYQPDGTSTLDELVPNDVAVTKPPVVMVPGSGNFSIMFNTSTGQGGQTRYPTVVVSHPGYQEKVITLDPDDAQGDIKLERSYSNNTITARKIILSKLPQTYQLNAIPLNAAMHSTTPLSVVTRPSNDGGHQ